MRDEEKGKKVPVRRNLSFRFHVACRELAAKNFLILELSLAVAFFSLKLRNYKKNDK